jgi:hypothetical protein
LLLLHLELLKLLLLELLQSLQLPLFFLLLP